jgi:uncharacterized membrane protein
MSESVTERPVTDKPGVQRGGDLLTPERLLALSDGIFAFAATLLVVNLDVPSIPAGQEASALPGALASLFDQLEAFVLSFYLIAVFWTIHQRQFRYLRMLDDGLLWINLLSLLLVVLIPFSTALVSRYGDYLMGAVVFELNMLLAGLVFTGQFFYAVRRPHFFSHAYSSSEVRRALRRNLLIPAASTLAIGVAFVNPGLSTSAYWLILVYVLVERAVLKRRSASAS